MSTMSKTAAIAKARTAVGQPIGRGTSWQVYGPYYYDKLSGPTTAVNADSYWKARSARTDWVAEIALVLMGWETNDAQMAVYSARDRGWQTNVHALVAHAIDHK